MHRATRNQYPLEKTFVRLTLTALVCMGVTSEMKAIELVKMKIVKAGTTGNPDKFRKILVSPTVNTPKPFKGFGGFCGWPKVCRLQNGDIYVVFSAGYWHASWPTPLAETEGPAYAKHLGKERPWLLKWDCPIGAKMMWIRSRDNGRKWTRPKAFPVIPGAYAIGAITQVSDGTMFAAACIQLGEGLRGAMPTDPVEYTRIAGKYLMNRKTVVFRSDDDGRTWKEACRYSGLFRFPEHPQSLFEARDGGLLMLTNGIPFPAGKGWPTKKSHYVSVLLKSKDKGANWSLLSVLGHKDFDVEEGSAAYLPDGSIGTPSRCTSAWFQSYDDGKTWSAPRLLHKGSGTASRAMYKKGHLLVTADGVTVLVFCGGPGGSGQVIYSRDSGKTWIKPAPDRGFTYDPIAYYPSACALPDGSIFAVGDNQGFKNKFGPYGARSIAIRFRIKTPEEGEGIELLPIAGKPIARTAAKADRTLERK